jgi:protein gp37
MGAQSAIEWTDATWNPIRARNVKTGKVGWHCEHATTGCVVCYAERRNRWIGTGLPFKPGHLNGDVELYLDEEMLTAPLRWRRPRMVFVCSMTDLFADFVPDEWIDKMFAVMALSPQHTFQVLTKRAERMGRYMNANSVRDSALRANSKWPLGNVWLGVSTERQEEYEARKEHLRATPAAVRFFSFEPLIGPIKADYLGDWVIVGGESGPKARPMHPQWARDLRDQCAAAGVPFFFKQWGEWRPCRAPVIEWSSPDGLKTAVIKVMPDPGSSELGTATDEQLRRAVLARESTAMARVGKKAAGRLLDGIEHNAMPAIKQREAAA